MSINDVLIAATSSEEPDLQHIQRVLKAGVPEYILDRALVGASNEYDTKRGMIELLLEYGADPNKALTTAFKKRNVNLLQLLKRYGAHIPEPMGYPGMKCKIEKFECDNDADRAAVKHWSEQETKLANYFLMASLAVGCPSKMSPKAFYVARHGDILCGSLVAEYHPKMRAIEIEFLSTQGPVNANMRGVGTDLMERFFMDCQASHVSFIFLLPLTAAVPFYEKFGFTFFEAKRLRKYMYKVITPPMPLVTTFADFMEGED